MIELEDNYFIRCLGLINGKSRWVIELDTGEYINKRGEVESYPDYDKNPYFFHKRTRFRTRGEANIALSIYLIRKRS